MASFVGAREQPMRSLHGRPLTNYEKSGEDLVVVHNVQIFEELKSGRFPYQFSAGIETIPALLGDLNVVGKNSRSMTPWDQNQIEECSIVFEFGVEPKTVSVKCSVRKRLACASRAE